MAKSRRIYFDPWNPDGRAVECADRADRELNRDRQRCARLVEFLRQDSLLTVAYLLGPQRFARLVIETEVRK